MGRSSNLPAFPQLGSAGIRLLAVGLQTQTSSLAASASPAVKQRDWASGSHGGFICLLT